MINRRTLLFVVLVLVVSLVLTPAVSAQEEEEPTVITLTMTEYAFAVDGQETGEALELEAGKPYTLHFIHAGALEHEVLFGRDAIELAEGMHRDYEESLLDDVPVRIDGMMNGQSFYIGMPGLIEFEMHPEQELSVTFTVPEEKVGEWEIGCFVFLTEGATEENPSPTHWDVMMRLPLMVVEASE